jgi:hypothetical protein
MYDINCSEFTKLHIICKEDEVMMLKIRLDVMNVITVFEMAEAVVFTYEN